MCSKNCLIFGYLLKLKGYLRCFPCFPVIIMNQDASKMTVSERRASYPLQQRLKIYSPETMARRLDQKHKAQGKLVVNGVNLLNKSSLDTDIIMDRIKQRRETHNRVERRRRDMLVMIDVLSLFLSERY